MSQPMPYTPWDKSWDPVDGDVYLIPPIGDDYLCWFDVDLESRMKRLTNEQCAAEYWRAFTIYNAAVGGAINTDPIAANHQLDVWHRFAATPHAFEVDDE